TVFTTAFHFDDITTSTEDLPIEAYTICDARHSYTGITEGPLASMELMHPAPGIATSVGGVVPGAVVHDGPTHELGARVVRVAVEIEEIGHGETPDGNGIAVHRARTAELVSAALCFFAPVTEAKILGNVKAREIRLGCGCG